MVNVTHLLKPYDSYVYKEHPYVRHRRFTYIIRQEHICSSSQDKQNILLIMFVCTRGENFFARDVLRKTWLRDFLGNNGEIRYIFIIGKQGKDRNLEYQKKIMIESELYGDILQEDFIDTYENLTLKTIMGLKWVSQNCHNAKYVMKIDDDVYLNVPILISAIEQYGLELQTSIGGLCFRNGYPERSESNKFRLSIEDYPHDRYPPYCSGTSYITSASVAKQLYEVSKTTRLFQFEDVFIGFCLAKVGHGWTQIPGFAVTPSASSTCKSKRSQAIVTLHPMSPADIIAVWESTCTHSQVLLHIGGINV